MSTFKKRLIITLLGVAAGLLAWPVVELLVAGQGMFPSYLVFNICFGALFGLILGAFFGTGEGIITGERRKILSGLLTGSLVGLAGGIIGFLIGQGALLLVGTAFFRSYDSFNTVGLPVSRAIGWAFMGIFVGMAEGVRARAGKKILVGILGGLAGGVIGGFLIEYLKIWFPGLVVARLAGLVIFGALIGLFYSIIEKQFSFGTLKLLNGTLKGKEFFINQRKIRIGSSKGCDIYLPDYDILEKHGVIISGKKGVTIKKATPEATLEVNEQKVETRELKYEDVIKLGRAKLFFRHQ